jgi:hypothetical protein
MGSGGSGLELISWQGWGVTGSIATLLILFTTILLWLLPFPSGSVRAQLERVGDRVDLRARLGAEPAFARYRMAVRRFNAWLQQWFGPPWSAQAFERCVAIAFVFPVALFLTASVLYGYKHDNITSGELLLFVFGVVMVSIIVRVISHLIYWGVQRMWRTVGGDNELAELVARILLGAFAVVFAFAIAFAVASSLAGQFSDIGTVVFAILGGFAFAFAFALAFAIAGIWALGIALVIVTALALTMAKQFAFFLLLFFVILPVLNALMDWVSWAVTRYLIGWMQRAVDGPAGVVMVASLLLANIAAALVLMTALAIVLPIGLELADLMLSIFGRGMFDWRSVAVQAVRAPWDEGLFVTGMLLTPLVPSIANMTISLAALAAPYTRGAGDAIPAISDHPEAVPADPEIRQAVRAVYLTRLWYIPALALSLTVYIAVWGIFYLLQIPLAQFLYTLALCSTAWSHGQCPAL